MDVKAHYIVTFESALKAGMTRQEADLFAKGSMIPDIDEDEDGRKTFSDAEYHVKVNPFVDLRRGTAARQREDAIRIWRGDDEEHAMVTLGEGAHALQDAIVHGGIARSVLLHRKRCRALRRVQELLRLRDIDCWETTPMKIRSAVLDETFEYAAGFMREAGRC